MEFFNEFQNSVFSKDDLEKLIICSAPILPHLTEEIWSKTGHEYSVHMQGWPEIDNESIKEEEIEIPVQINGKVRGKVKITSDLGEDEVERKVLAEAAFKKYLVGGKVRKFIYVPERIVNVVT